MRSIMLAAVCAVVIAAKAQAAIKEEPVTYQDGVTTMKGFVVYDDAVQGKRPGVVMVHEWWGITKHIRNEAQKFAEQGYTAFVADMYGDAKTADNPKAAGALSGSVMKDPKAMEGCFNAARAQLAKHPTADPTHIGAVGYCFGGAVVLNMARAGADLAAVAGFHASLGLNTPAPAPGTVKAKILVLNGADDPFAKRDQYETLKKDLDAGEGRLPHRRVSGRGACLHQSRSDGARPEVQPAAPVRREGGPRSEGGSIEILRRELEEVTSSPIRLHPKGVRCRGNTGSSRLQMSATASRC
jgi:dienelactone hydrolase